MLEGRRDGSLLGCSDGIEDGRVDKDGLVDGHVDGLSEGLVDGSGITRTWIST